MNTIKNLPKVEHMGANHCIVRDWKQTIFQSYDSIIAVVKWDKTFLDSRTWDYSTTTGKFRNQFLNEDKKETQKKIDSKEYILADLNYIGY